MAFNDPQTGVLVNPLPFISGVQDPTLIPRAAASRDMVAQGAAQVEAMTQSLTPRANAETQAAIAEANVRRRNAEDAEMNDAKKLLVVAQGASAKAALRDMEFSEANRPLKELIAKESWRQELETQSLGMGPEAAHAANALLMDAGIDTPKTADNRVDTDEVKRLIPGLRRWQRYQADALRAASSENVADQTYITPSQATATRRIRKDTQQPWSQQENQELLKLGRLSYSAFQKKEADGSLPSIAQPLASLAPGTATTAPAAPAAPTTAAATPIPGSPDDFLGANNLIAGADGVLRDPQGNIITKLPSGGKDKVPTESQSKAADYSNRMDLAERAYQTLVGQGNFDPAGFTTWIQSQPWYFDGLRSGKMTVFDAVVDEFANAILRRDSGAAITADERASYRKMFFPRIGDSDTAKALKQAQRQSIQLALSREGAGQISALTPAELAGFNQQVAAAAAMDYEGGGSKLMNQAIADRIAKASGGAVAPPLPNGLPAGAVRTSNPGEWEYVENGLRKVVREKSSQPTVRGIAK